jgi:hypothetical protein
VLNRAYAGTVRRHAKARGGRLLRALFGAFQVFARGDLVVAAGRLAPGAIATRVETTGAKDGLALFLGLSLPEGFFLGCVIRRRGRGPAWRRRFFVRHAATLPRLLAPAAH